MRAAVVGLASAIAFTTLAVWLGLRVGIMTAYFFGVVGCAVGWYIGARAGRRYFE